MSHCRFIQQSNDETEQELFKQERFVFETFHFVQFNSDFIKDEAFGFKRMIFENTKVRKLISWNDFFHIIR